MQGYPIFISDTTVGNGVTSVDSQDSSVVGIGTTFCDNIYIVHDRDTPNGEAGAVVCNIHTNSSSSVLGIAVTGNFNNSNPGIATHIMEKLVGVDYTMQLEMKLLFQLE